MLNQNVSQVLNLLVRELGIPVTRQSIEEEIPKHPEADSLLAINELLAYWKIPNGAFELTFDELKEVPLPFVTCFTNHEFVLVTKLDDEKAIVSNNRWTNHKMGLKEFKKSYTGSVLVAEKDEDSGEADYQKKRRKELVESWRMPFVYAGAAILLLSSLLFHTAYTGTLNVQIGLLTLFKTAGVGACILLLIQSIDANNPLIKKLCTGDNNKDCNAILSSPSAKISEELSWSEVGFFYFSGTWLVLLFNGGNANVLSVLAILSVLSLPYTVYSIYFQWRVAKQWCVFCCCVQALLWLDFFAFLPTLLYGLHNPGLNDWTALIAGMAAPVLAWVLLKPLLLKTKQIAALTDQLKEFKYNAGLFKKLLKDEQLQTLLPEEHSVIIGNREAEHVITMVSSPSCQPCSRAHKKLDDWLASRDDIKLQVVFGVSGAENDLKTMIATHLMSLQQSPNGDLLHQAMSDWYEHKQSGYEAWVAAYPVTQQFDHNEALTAQREWCEKAEIKGTPTLFINGRKLPENYQLDDIRYLI